MDKNCQTVRLEYILERLNDIRLYLQVSRLSDIVNKEGSEIEAWAMYGPPQTTDLIWPKQRKPLAVNMKL